MIDQIVAAIQEKSTTQKGGSVVVAISGFGGSGKSYLANQLKQELKNANVISIDSFALNHLSNRSSDWEGLDFDRFTQEVLMPAKKNEPIMYGVYDWPANAVTHTETLQPSTYLIVEGCGILQQKLLSFYDYCIWIDMPLEEATKRGIARDRAQGATWDENWFSIWMPNEQDFFSKHHPDRLADIIYPAQI